MAITIVETSWNGLIPDHTEFFMVQDWTLPKYIETSVNVHGAKILTAEDSEVYMERYCMGRKITELVTEIEIAWAQETNLD